MAERITCYKGLQEPGSGEEEGEQTKTKSKELKDAKCKSRYNQNLKSGYPPERTLKGKNIHTQPAHWGLPWALSRKEHACHAGHTGLTSESGRSPGGNGNPLQ